MFYSVSLSVKSFYLFIHFYDFVFGFWVVALKIFINFLHCLPGFTIHFFCDCLISFSESVEGWFCLVGILEVFLSPNDYFSAIHFMISW